jgi:threonine aldolase
MTVGSGITPDLLTSQRERSRARRFARHYRRWGIAPRPENVADCIIRRRAVCNTDFQNVHGAFLMVFISFSYKPILASRPEALII